MRLKVEPKDLIIFGIFCVFLLYICCIGVLNASYLASEGKFYGTAYLKTKQNNQPFQKPRQG